MTDASEAQSFPQMGGSFRSVRVMRTGTYIGVSPPAVVRRQQARAVAAAVHEEEVEGLLLLTLARHREDGLLADVLGLVEDPLQAVAYRFEAEEVLHRVVPTFASGHEVGEDLVEGVEVALALLLS